MPGVGTTAMGSCSGGETLDSTLNTTRKSGWELIAEKHSVGGSQRIENY